ncbi:hypothetical protein LSH36_40g02024 [Paralvinella palmiformis]|uniref:Glycoprotein-N-acetylgalactosamine 3-beta-galactosyltransferase 1 n=1 Tax=Paralvinella palmiformis TaxID=53620 RepID=A0AAD9K8Z3_9ANNE|nr:hypothetical protein LSH36_40g02024 [Paralvinella palmiformis]
MVGDTMSSGLCFYSGLSSREIFTALICITIIVHGVAHLLLTHNVTHRSRYTAVSQDGRTFRNKSLPTPTGRQRDVRILCMIMTNHESIWSHGVHVNNTWGRRCNRIVFISDVSDPDISSVVGIYAAAGGAGQSTIRRLYDSFDYVYDHHFNDADWFLKCRAGYVLSKAALKKLRTRPKDLCQPKGEGVNEDVQVSTCLRELGVQMGDTRDAEGRTTFHALSPMMHLAGGFPDWYRFRSVWGIQKVCN